MLNPILVGQGMFSIPKLHRASLSMWPYLCGGVQGKKKNWPVIFGSTAQLASYNQNNSQYSSENVAVLCLSVISAVTNMQHFDTKPYCSPSLPPFWFCCGNVFGLFSHLGRAQLLEDEGLGGRLATGRHLAPRLASAHCCQPFSNQQPSMCLAAEGVSNQLLAPS